MLASLVGHQFVSIVSPLADPSDCLLERVLKEGWKFEDGERALVAASYLFSYFSATSSTPLFWPWSESRRGQPLGTALMRPYRLLASGWGEDLLRSPGKEGTEMNPDRFDDLTKALATSPSRRRALKTIAAATLGSILGLGGIGTAFAKCKGGHRCTMDKTCCSKHCCNGVCCPAGQQCCGDFGCAVVCPTPT